jgi:hypothetical protein
MAASSWSASSVSRSRCEPRAVAWWRRAGLRPSAPRAPDLRCACDAQAHLAQEPRGPAPDLDVGRVAAARGRSRSPPTPATSTSEGTALARRERRAKGGHEWRSRPRDAPVAGDLPARPRFLLWRQCPTSPATHRDHSSSKPRVVDYGFSPWIPDPSEPDRFSATLRAPAPMGHACPSPLLVPCLSGAGSSIVAAVIRRAPWPCWIRVRHRGEPRERRQSEEGDQRCRAHRDGLVLDGGCG